MTRNLLTLAAALIVSLGATAQSALLVEVANPGGLTHECILADDAVWQSFGLNADQLARVKAIQDRCRKDCETSMKEKGTYDHAAMERHEKELQTVLTTEQFTKWQKWCKELEARKPAPEKSEPGKK